MRRKIKEEEFFELRISSKEITVILKGDVLLENAGRYGNLMMWLREKEGCGKIIIDLSGIGRYDTYLAVLIKDVRKHAAERSAGFFLQGAESQLNKFLGIMDRHSSHEERRSSKKEGLSNYFYTVGENTQTIMKDFRSFVEYFGILTVKLINSIRKPGQIRWKDFPAHFSQSGVNAFPITLLIIFLIGLISGYQGALQLHNFGADIYIANLVGISITRELAPLMTAIIVAGRSGSAFAAELGTMKVSEEIDALRTMGFDIYKFLVLPRILSVTLAMPLLTLFADVAGIAGGLAAAITTISMTTTGYINQLNTALTVGDIFGGLFKSAVFGFLVASVGCFRGLQARGGAESVGRFTTSSVVTGIFLIILTDAVFTFLFRAIGI